MKFSIVLASRERSTLLVEFLRSIERTADNLSELEVIIGIDDCDPEMHDCKRHVEGWYSWVKFFSQPRSEWLNRDYLNYGYKTYGTGKYAIICNDDCVFKTKHWDVIFENRMEDYLKDKFDRIAYAYMSDGLTTSPGSYCCFPGMTREGISAIGGVMIKEFRSWNSDLILRRVYDSVQRCVEIPEIMLYHDSYHVKSRPRDKTSFHVEKINQQSNSYNVAPFELYHKNIVDAIAKGGVKHL